jgi:iron complex transport system permease protein
MRVAPKGHAPAGRPARLPLSLLLGGGLVTLGTLLVLHLGLGSVALTPFEVMTALRDPAADPVHRQIVFDLRLPRALVAAVAGALLGTAGALLQSVLRNPLAEPGLIGISAGGAFAAALWLTTGQTLATPGRSLPLVVLVGGLLAALLVYGLSWNRRADPLRLVLCGVLVSAVFQGATSLVMLLGSEAIGGVLVWLIGSLHGRVWLHWQILWPWAAVTLPLALACAGLANVLQLGDDVAAGLGLQVEWTRVALLGVSALLTAGAVAAVGAVGFIGLVGPHIVRRLVGEDARQVLPLSALLSAALLLGADVIAQGLIITTAVGAVDTRTGLPVGAVTALLGAPVLLVLLRQRRRT